MVLVNIGKMLIEISWQY